MNANFSKEPLYTREEIFQQPALWPATLRDIEDTSKQLNLSNILKGSHVLLTGAGSSAYAASSIATAWPRIASAVPSTDLLVDTVRYLRGIDVVVSLARSGDSTESTAVVNQIRDIQPDILQIAITCNAEGALAQSDVNGLILLNPRTDDRNMVMTSSFSNLVLAGLCLAEFEGLAAIVDQATASACRLLPTIDEACSRVATRVTDWIVVLASSPLHGWSAKGGLKALKMTGGHVSVVSETYLGLRHGAMSLVRSDTFALCLLSNDPLRRLYELDLIRELRSKTLGYLAVACVSSRHMQMNPRERRHR